MGDIVTDNTSSILLSTRCSCVVFWGRAQVALDECLSALAAAAQTQAVRACITQRGTDLKVSLVCRRWRTDLSGQHAIQSHPVAMGIAEGSGRCNKEEEDNKLIQIEICNE